MDGESGKADGKDRDLLGKSMMVPGAALDGRESRVSGFLLTFRHGVAQLIVGGESTISWTNVRRGW